MIEWNYAHPAFITYEQQHFLFITFFHQYVNAYIYLQIFSLKLLSSLSNRHDQLLVVFHRIKNIVPQIISLITLLSWAPHHQTLILLYNLLFFNFLSGIVRYFIRYIALKESIERMYFDELKIPKGRVLLHLRFSEMWFILVLI